MSIYTNQSTMTERFQSLIWSLSGIWMVYIEWITFSWSMYLFVRYLKKRWVVCVMIEEVKYTKQSRSHQSFSFKRDHTLPEIPFKTVSLVTARFFQLIPCNFFKNSTITWSPCACSELFDIPPRWSALTCDFVCASERLCFSSMSKLGSNVCVRGSPDTSHGER